MSITVVWKNYLEGVQARGFYDQSLVTWMFDQTMPGGFTFDHSDSYPDDPTEGCVLVMPGHTRNNDVLNEDIRRREWMLIIVTSDEEGEYPFWGIIHPNRSIWKQWPRQNLPWQPDRVMPLGWTPGTVEANQERPVKIEPWFFAGQITHPRREQAVLAMRQMTGGKLIETSTFLQTSDGGINAEEYRQMMRRARVVPCPSGPNTQDTFRLYEALEAGAVPLADATSPRGDRGHWGRTFGDVPFPIVDDWLTIPALVEEWHTKAKRVEVLAWWEQAKRDLIWRLHDDISQLFGTTPKTTMTERITVLMPTSPIPSHPSTSIIEQTIASVKQRLPSSEIIVMADGVRPELEHRRPAYEEYLEEVVWLCRKWRAVPLVFSEHQHQANMTRRALELVRTDLTLFVEHDTPLVGDIPWYPLGHWILTDDLNVIRFHYEQEIPQPHQWLMRGPLTFVKDHRNYRFERTVQWSQRPHLARTEQYRRWIGEYFPVTSNTMIEDHMHGIVANSEWEDFRVAIWTPRGSIQRSTHLDGRGDDSKFPELMHA